MVHVTWRQKEILQADLGQREKFHLANTPYLGYQDGISLDTILTSMSIKQTSETV